MPDEDDEAPPANVIPFPAVRANAKLAEMWVKETAEQNAKLSQKDKFKSPLQCLDEIMRRRGLPVFCWPAEWPQLAERCRCYPGDVVIVTGPTGAGKTSFAIQVGLSFTGAGIPVLWCALELDATQITERLVANMHGVHTMAIKEHWSRERIAHSLAIVDDMWRFVERNMDPVAQLAAVRRAIALVFRIYRVKPVVIVDYLGKLSSMADNIRQATIQAAESIRALAVEEECFVLLLAQPSRAKNQALTGKVEHDSATDTSGSAAESGEAENAAAIEINLEVFKVDDAAELDARWNVAKSRHVGREGKVGALFTKAGGKWSELDYVPVHPMAVKAEVEKQKKDKNRTENPQDAAEVRKDLNLTQEAEAARARKLALLDAISKAAGGGIREQAMRSIRAAGRLPQIRKSLAELEAGGAILLSPDGAWRLAPR